MNFVLTLLPLAIRAVAQEAQIPLEPITSQDKALTLDGIPTLGFGTWNLKESNTSEAVSWAIQAGYRHIDAAAIYGNEDEVGAGIADGLIKTGLSREDLWITSKLWNDHHDINRVEAAIDQTIRKLRVGYLDLYHMHWPVADTIGGGHKIDFRDTWGAMTLLLNKGKTRHIGVCNFSPEQLQSLLNHTSIPPAVHQMEMHPYLQQNSWLAWHRAHGIHVTAYSPLAGTNPTYDESDGPTSLLNSSTVLKIAEKRGCTPAQVVLRWGLSRKGVSVIPKSIHKDRISENFHSTACKLTSKDLRKIAKLEKYHHRYNNPSESWKVDLYEGLEDSDGKHKKGDFKSDCMGNEIELDVNDE